MLKQLGSFIEHHPVIVVMMVLLVTLGFSVFIPSVEFKTDFENFMPDDDLVRANDRIIDYFGTNQQVMFILAEQERVNTVLDVQAIRELHELQQQLKQSPAVNGTISITMFIDIMCSLEFGDSLENCTDEQIQTVLDDLLIDLDSNPEQISNDDSADDVDFQQPLLLRKTPSDAADIKNLQVSSTNQTITFAIEVYDLSDYETLIQPAFPRVNVMEWFVDFNNLFTPVPELDISYTIAAHIEPTQPWWTVGNSLLDNLRHFFSVLKNRELFNSYTAETILWIQPPNQTMSFPVPLNSGEITFNTEDNRIEISVDRKELGTYGISPSFGDFSLPAKLSDFTAGVRYYDAPWLFRPGGHVEINTEFLLERTNTIQQRPILGSLAERLLQRIGGISFDSFTMNSPIMENGFALPESIAIYDMQTNWVTADTFDVDDEEQMTLYLYPKLFNDLQVNLVSFLSEDFKDNHKPQQTIVILQLPQGEDYDDFLGVNQEAQEIIQSFTQSSTVLSYQTTGQGIIAVEVNEVTSEANQFIMPAIFVIIIIVLFLSFRRISYVILSMLALLIATIWLFGSMALLQIDFSVIAIALVPLVMGLGVDYSVHLFHNYRSERERGRTPAMAIRRSVREIGNAMFLAMITTVIAFLSFLSATVPPIRDFGILLALGVTYTFITAITLSASLRYLIDTRKKKPKNVPTRQIKKVRNLMGSFAQLVLNFQKTLLALMIVITLIFAVGATQLEIGFSQDQFAPQNTPAFDTFDEIAENFPSASQDQELILLEGDVATVEALRGIRETQENLIDDTYVTFQTDGSLKVTSPYTVIKTAVMSNESLIDRFHLNPSTYIPKSDRDVKALYNYLLGDSSTGDGESDEDMMMDFDISMVSGSALSSVIHKNNSHFDAALIRVYIDPSLQTKAGNINQELGKLKREMEQDLVSYGTGVTAIATGNYHIQLSITTSLTESQFFSTFISLLLAAIVLIIAYRNPLLGVIAMLPVSITILWILGTMYYIGYTLNALTVTVTSITIGIGIDYAIHATERFRLVADRTGDIKRAMCETISHTGGALLIAALTTSLGFGILMFAPIPPQQQFGIILAITIAYAFLTSVLILPLILVRWANWRKKRIGYIIRDGPPDDDDFDEDREDFCPEE